MSEQPNDPGNEPLLGGRYRIYPDKPLPGSDTMTAFAVEASDQRATTRRLTAMVCKPGLVPRLDIIPQLSRLTRLNMINPVDAGPVAWPETGGRRFVVLFDRLLGEPLAASLDAEITPLREDQVFQRIVKPILPTLKELSSRAIKHRSIRADNVFYTDGSRSSVVLGECVSGPPGMSQPSLYEPIDAAMANVSGRGQGTLADDLYALGVLMAVLLTGANPARGLSDEEVIESKINRGSYSTLIQSLPLSIRMIEPLRGLLCDEPNERWEIDDLLLWAGGRQLSPKQPMLPAKAARAIQFGDKEYLTRPGLSHAMGCRWGQAATLVTGGQLASWLKRSFGDEEGDSAIQGLFKTAGEGSKTEDRLVSGALMVLEPRHPLRYREISARIDGLATMLAMGYGDEKFRDTFVQMMRANLPLTYLHSTGAKGPDQVALKKTFDLMAHFMERPQIGNGLERALYEANRGWPCQSPFIADDYVCELNDILPALERAARRASGGDSLVDRDIAGFCAARSKSLAEIVPRTLGASGDLASKRLGVLAFYAEVHRVTGPSRRYPALTAWLAATMTPVIESYRNRALRNRQNKAVDRIGGEGDMTALFAVLNDDETKNEDILGFADAREEYERMESSIKWLVDGGLSSLENVLPKSRQAATFVSAMIASLALVALSIAFVA